MAGKRKISAIIALDGEKEFKQAVTNVNKELGNLKAQSKLTSEQFAGQANTVEALQKKHEILTKIVDAHRKKEEELKKGLKNAQDVYGKYGDELEKLKKRYQTASEKMEKMETSSKYTKKELEAQRKEVEYLAEGVKGSEEKYQSAAIRIKDWETKLSRAQAETIKANRALDENKKYLTEAENSTDKCAKSIDEYGKKVKEAVKPTLEWKEAVKAAIAEKGIDVAANAMSGLVDASVGTAKDIQAATNQIQASTGASVLSMKEYQNVLESVYKNNYGENFSDVANVIKTVKENINNLNNSDLQEITEGAITLRDTFDMDVNETIRGANGLIENMGVDATTAFDLIAKGAQNGLNKTDELGDNLAEYTQIWGQAEFSAEEMFAILENGLDSGAYNLDKINDFVKEFTISLSDGRIEESLGNFSEETQNLFIQWQSGSATAAQVFHSVIDDLASMENQQEALTLASNTWSALGEDNAMKVITSLNNVNDTYKNVQGTMEKIQDIKYDDVTNQLTQTARIIQMKIAGPLVEEILPKINKGLETAGENIEVVSAGIAGVGTLIAVNRAKETKLGQETIKVLKKIFIAKTAENMATEAGAAATTKNTTMRMTETLAIAKQTAATKLLSAEQKVYNALASLSPAGKIALVIGGAVAAYKALHYAIVETDEELVKNREEVKSLCDEYDNLQDSIDSAAQERKDSIEDITAQYMGYQTMAEKLVDLADKENKSSGEMALMQEYVNQLNEAMPSLNLAIDEQTGKLNMNADAIYAQVDAIKERAYYSAYEETLKDILEEQADASLELAKIEEEKVDVKKKLAALEEEYAESISNTSDAMQDYEGATYNATGTAVEFWMQHRELSNQLDDLTEREKAANATISSLGSEYDNATNIMAQMGEKYSSAADTTEELTSAEADAAAATVGATDEMSEAMEKLKESVQSSIQNSISMFEEFSGGTEISATEILDNLNSQIDGISNWADNMETLAGAAGSGMTEEFYEYLAEMGPESANLVQELVNTLNGDSSKFTEICDTWTEAMNLDSMADSITTGFSDAQKAAKEGQEKFQEEFEKLTGQTYKAGMDAGFDSISEAAERNIGLAKTEGYAVIESHGTGMTDATPLVETAAQNTADSIINKWSYMPQQAYDNGVHITEGVAKGINDGAPTAIAAATNLANSINKAFTQKEEIKSPSRVFKRYGAYISQGVAIGITQAKNEAEDSIKDMCSSLEDAAKSELEIHSPSRKFKKNVGAQITKGIALGINEETQNAIMSMRSTADRLYSEALKTISKQAGKKKPDTYLLSVAQAQLTQADELQKAAAKLRKSALNDYSKSIYKTATAWFTEYQKTNKVTLEDQKYFWKQLRNNTVAGTKEYTKALSKVEGIEKYEKLVKSKLKNAFNVSEYTTGTNGEQQLKSTADYYSEIYSAANKYFSNYSVLHNVSLQKEEYYWQQVVKKMKKGTQGYVDAMKQLKTVQSEIKQEIAQTKENNKQYALSGGALETYKTYYQVSAKAEVQYWDIVRKKFKTGTKERIEADQKYYEAKENYNSKLEDLNQEYYENVKEVNEKLEDDIQSLTDTYNDAVKERKDAIYSSFGLFDEFESTSSSGQTLLYNLKTQVAGIADWEQQLSVLGKKGVLSDGLLKELQEMGPEASASIHALNQLSSEELAEYNKLWKQKNALAESQAVKENETLRKETKSQISELKQQAKEEIAAYKKEYNAAVKDLKKSIEAPLKNLAKQATKIGEDTAASLVASIKNSATKKSTTADLQSVNTKISKQLGKLPKAGKTIGTNTLQGILDGLKDEKKINSSAKSLVDALKKAIQKAADIHSPSRLFKKEIGVQLSAGVASGITEESKSVNAAGTAMIQDLLEKQKAELDKQQASLQSYAAEINTGAGLVELNNLIKVAPVQQVTATVDNTAMMGMFSEMLGMMREYMPQMANMQMVTDTGALIGELSSGMSEAFAMAQRRRR